MTIAPLFPLRFRLLGTMLQFKPYPAYPTWLDAADLSVVSESVAAEIARATEAEAAIDVQITDLDDRLVGTDAVAAQALTDAATAYNFAESNNNARSSDIDGIWARLDALENP